MGVRIGRLQGESHLRMKLAQRDRDLDATEPWHVDIEERDLRSLLEPELNGLGPVLRFEYRDRLDLVTGAGGQQGSHPGVVVCD